MSQVCSSYRIEFKIVILSIFFGVDKKFDTAVFVGRAVGGGALRQDVFFPDVENDPNLIFYMANPKLYFRRVVKLLPIDHIYGIQRSVRFQQFFDIGYTSLTLVVYFMYQQFLHILLIFTLTIDFRAPGNPQSNQ